MELKVSVSEAIALIKEVRRGGSPIKILYQGAMNLPAASYGVSEE